MSTTITTAIQYDSLKKQGWVYRTRTPNLEPKNGFYSITLSKTKTSNPCEKVQAVTSFVARASIYTVTAPFLAAITLPLSALGAAITCSCKCIESGAVRSTATGYSSLVTDYNPVIDATLNSAGRDEDYWCAKGLANSNCQYYDYMEPYQVKCPPKQNLTTGVRVSEEIYRNHIDTQPKISSESDRLINV